jgi:hypothetical protein
MFSARLAKKKRKENKRRILYGTEKACHNLAGFAAMAGF